MPFCPLISGSVWIALIECESDIQISAACTRVHPIAQSIKSLSSFVSSPVAYLERYTASQSADLGKALGDHELGHKEGWRPRTEKEWEQVVRQARI